MMSTTTALVCTRAVWAKHWPNGGGGAIVFSPSTAAWLYSNFYGLAKVGVNGLTQQLARELGGMKIRINAIAPTDRLPKLPAPSPRRAGQTICCRADGYTEDLMGMCRSCCRIRHRGSPGQIFNVDGGQIIRS